MFELDLCFLNTLKCHRQKIFGDFWHHLQRMFDSARICLGQHLCKSFWFQHDSGMALQIVWIFSNRISREFLLVKNVIDIEIFINNVYLTTWILPWQFDVQCVRCSWFTRVARKTNRIDTTAPSIEQVVSLELWLPLKPNFEPVGKSPSEYRECTKQLGKKVFLISYICSSSW